VALWGRKIDTRVPVMAASVNGRGGHELTGLEQHEARGTTWQTRAGGAPPPAAPESDFVLTPEMAEPEHLERVTVAQPEPEPAPAAAAPEPQPSAFEAIEPTDDTGRSQFFAGQGVKLKADVSGCDIFRIEGDFEGQVTARRMFISPTGAFRGTGTVEEAVVEGRVDGVLAVVGVLSVRASGRVSGNVRYGEIEVERGGHVHGDIAPKAVEQAAAPRVSAPRPQPAAEADPLISRKQPPMAIGGRRPVN